MPAPIPGHDCARLVEKCACCGVVIGPDRTFCPDCKAARVREQKRRSAARRVLALGADGRAALPWLAG